MDRGNVSISNNNNMFVNNAYTKYLSGSDIRVYIDTFFIKEVTGVVIQEQVNRIPYYGYDSRYYDYVFDGRVLVSGNIMVSVHTPLFLYRVLSGLGYMYNTEEDSNMNEDMFMYVEDDEQLFDVLNNINLDDLDNNRNTSEGELVIGRHFDLDLFVYKETNYTHVITLKDVELLGVNTQFVTDDSVYEVYSYLAREVVTKTIT